MQPRPRMQSSQVRGIGLLIGLAVLAVVVVTRFLGGPSVTGPDTTPTAPAFAGDPAAVVRSSALFMTNCASCHGATGRGDGPAAASLNPRPADFTSAMHRVHPDIAIENAIEDGVAGSAMPAFAETLSESDIADLIVFIRSIQAQFVAETIPIPDPAECTIAPVSPQDFMPDGTITPKPAPTPAPPVGPETFPWPQGAAASDDEIEGVTRTLREFSACANAGDYPRRLALYTDRAIRPQFDALDEAGWASTLTFVATPAAELPSEQREWVDSITAVRSLPDGRVGAHVVTIDPVNHPHQSAAVVIFAKVGDRWLIDEVHQDLIGPAELTTPEAGSGVPVAGPETPVASGGLTVRMEQASAAGAVVLQLLDAAGEPVDGATIEIAADMPEMTMGLQVMTAESIGDGRYRAQVPLGMSGEWEFLALITPPTGDPIQVRFVATID